MTNATSVFHSARRKFNDTPEQSAATFQHSLALNPLEHSNSVLKPLHRPISLANRATIHPSHPRGPPNEMCQPFRPSYRNADALIKSPPAQILTRLSFKSRRQIYSEGSSELFSYRGGPRWYLTAEEKTRRERRVEKRENTVEGSFVLARLSLKKKSTPSLRPGRN